MSTGIQRAGHNAADEVGSWQGFARASGPGWILLAATGGILLLVSGLGAFNPAHLGDLPDATALDRVSASVEVISGVLAIAITVVAIVVELAANRYTPRITQLFIRERTSQCVLGLFVVTTLVCLWLSLTPSDRLQNPRVVVLVAAGMLTVSVAALLPYFAYLFRFLAPRNIISRIQEQAFAATNLHKALPKLRGSVTGAITELEDITRRARQQRDRGIAMAAVDALDRLMRDSLNLASQLPKEWFALDEDLLSDPDFVALSSIERDAVESQRLWVETKILRQYLSLFEESLGVDRDLGNLVALKTRSISRDYGRQNDALSDLCVRFFNSYLRCAIRQEEMRSAYYVLDQYRTMAEDELLVGDPRRALGIVGYMRYYGHFAFEVSDGFLLEVVATDVAKLIEHAFEFAPQWVDKLLEEFVEIDLEDPTEAQTHERRLRGVRRAQIQLATFFLEKDDEDRARQIWNDMRHENLGRLLGIRAELDSDQPQQYWEFTDRGINFAYLSPERRAQLELFYDWFKQDSV